MSTQELVFSLKFSPHQGRQLTYPLFYRCHRPTLCVIMKNLMSEVYVDGEKVVFEGDMPGKPAEIYDLLMTVLSEQGRAVTGFVSDGVNLLSGEQPPETFQRIEASSLSHRELTLQVIREFLDKMGTIGDDLRSYSKNILTTGWSEVFRRMDEFIGKIKPFADLFDNLTPYAKTYSPEWSTGFEQFAVEQADCLERVLSCFESGDVSGLSNEIAQSFAPLFERSRKFLAEEAITELEQPVETAS